MLNAAAELPDDIDALKALVRATVDAYETQVHGLRQQLETRVLEIESLKLQIAKLRRMQFGAKSEKLDRQIGQLELRLEELQADEGEAAVDTPASRQGTKRTSVRRPLPEHLPREDHVYELESPCCPDCGGALHLLGEDVSEQLEYVPGHWRVLRHRRPKKTCQSCEVIVQAAAPSRPIARGLPGPGLHAHVLVAKFCDHQPLYRQSDIYARDGVFLSRSTMADWVGQAGALLRPLVEAIRRYVLASGKVHADDTPVPVLDPGRGRTKTGRLWTYVRDDRPAGSVEPAAAWYAYSPGRSGEYAEQHLVGWRGALQADAFAGFNRLYVDGAIIEVGCWAHARRKFYDLYVKKKTTVNTEALARIAELFAIEAEIRGKLPDVRRGVRQARAGPLLQDLRTWLETTLLTLSMHSDTARAINYALNQWQALTRYVDDGRLEAENNAAERALRAVALGRKNYLHLGSDRGGDRAAAMYTLIGTCKLNGINPELYLRHVLAHIAEHPVNRIDELLPWAVVEKLRAA
ncbi:IS66 family transposase [Achromobacter xylosoxidans]|uniref:IS66 family transposase n=1 Tax=Alcaligenes xylosoxydans xylosoxydans TaxID=85698 RepID=UPI0015C7A293|nr:IS66 family transposase [Achromobacter xylosoxidans]NYS11443.1 IS66 family transposase [Achromobacter xylosoxidans]